MSNPNFVAGWYDPDYEHRASLPDTNEAIPDDDIETLNDVTAWLGRIFVALCAIATLLLIGLLTR